MPVRSYSSSTIARANSNDSMDGQTTARYSPRALIKSALIAGAFLNAGIVGWLISNTAVSPTHRLTPRLRRTHPLDSLPLALTQTKAGVVERYRNDDKYRLLLERVQELEAASLPPGTKSIAELNYAVLGDVEVKVKRTDKVVLFAMFTPHGTVSDETRYYVDSLKKKFDHVIGIVATDDDPKSLRQTPVTKLFSAVIARENLGLDFPGWALAMRVWPNVWDAAQLVCTNDSVLGPLDPTAFDKMLSRIDTSPNDFIGLTESLVGLDPALHERGTSLAWHYQSYFVAFKNRAMSNPEVQSFWYDGVFALADKAQVIRQYELGMTIKMKAAGMKTEALFSRVPTHSLENPVISAPDELLQLGFPFIKRELFRSAQFLHFLLRVDLAGATQRYPVMLPPLPSGTCEPDRHRATLTPLRRSGTQLAHGGAIESVRWTSPQTLQIRGWSAAPTLRVGIDPIFKGLEVSSLWRTDLVVATRDPGRGCDGFVMDLTSQTNPSPAVDSLQLCIWGQDAQGHMSNLHNQRTPECDSAAAPAPALNGTRLSLRYEACGGMCNQIYSHLSAWALGHALGAEVQLAPAMTRSSFGDYDMEATNDTEAQKGVSWEEMPLSDLLDVTHLIRYGRGHGLRLRRGKPATLDPTLRVEVPRWHQLELPDLVRNVTLPLQEKAAELGIEQAKGPALTLQMPCSFLTVANLHTDPFVVELVRNLRLSPHIRSLAKKVSRGIDATGSGTYNGIHLRFERDATHAMSLYGGQGSYKEVYLQGVAKANFDDTLPIYISSGLLSYGDDKELRSFKRSLAKAGHRAGITYKEQFLDQKILATLAPEQQAALDFAVLADARQVVGIAWSSFSYFLREHRTLNGFAPEQTVLAGKPFFPEAYFRIVP